MMVLGIVLLSEQDASGIFGGIFHYSLIFALMGSALLAFLYFWRKKLLSFDEEPKIQMMHDDNKGDFRGR